MDPLVCHQVTRLREGLGAVGASKDLTRMGSLMILQAARMWKRLVTVRASKGCISSMFFCVTSAC